MGNKIGHIVVHKGGDSVNGILPSIIKVECRPL